VGKMPNGKMSWRVISTSGADRKNIGTDQAIVVHFEFPQEAGAAYDPEEHGGKTYVPRNDTAYLPLNDEGKGLLVLFTVAFERRVMFGLGERGGQSKVVWARYLIHIRTTLESTDHGWPCSTYTTSALEELSGNGVTVENCGKL
jgi:hypothetical protein